ncbi:MAG TPA: VanZ family protein [Vicinamibacterales bacterium]|nr:VanZ family protein [Vicinamibacterales bacterium]
MKPTATPGPRHRASPIALWAPVLAYMLVIFALSSMSHPPALPNGSDKWLHGVLYAGLGALFARAVAGGWHGVSLAQVLATACFGAVYGASDELHQYFNPPRNVEALDVLADTIGAAAAAAALHAWGIIRGRDGL